MSTPVKRRLIKDFKKMSTDPPQGISATPKDSDIMEWNAVIFGYVFILWEDESESNNDTNQHTFLLLN